jgi:hypothetical protein
MTACGLIDVEVAVQDEVAGRDTDAAMLWAHVAERLGPRLVEAGFLTQEQCSAAERSYRAFAQRTLESQTLCLRTVCARRV